MSFQIFLKIPPKYDQVYTIDLAAITTGNELFDLLKNKFVYLNKFNNEHIIFKNKIRANKIFKIEEEDNIDKYFILENTYEIDIVIPKNNNIKCLPILNELFNYLSQLRIDKQIIISLHSSNVENPYGDYDVVEKNILQQTQYKSIGDKENIIYILVDISFFKKEREYNEIFDILNCNELKIPYETTYKNIKLYNLNHPYYNRNTPEKYMSFFNKFVEPKIMNKNIYFFVVQCDLDDNNIASLIDISEKNDFDLLSFSGGKWNKYKHMLNITDGKKFKRKLKSKNKKK